jgi:hypothetical protein
MMGNEEIRPLHLISFTPLPELWQIFEFAVSLYGADDYGVRLTMLETYVNGTYGSLTECLNELNVTHWEFWNCMGYFLNRLNENIATRRANARRSQATD